MLGRNLLLGIALLIYSPHGHSQDGSSNQKIWNQALSAYDQGEYQDAIADFERLLDRDPEQGHVLYNLGNAYYKNGQSGQALAAYYAAKRLLPRDPDLNANIRYLQNFTKDNLEAALPEALWTKAFFWQQNLNLLESAWLASILVSLASLLFAGRFLFAKVARLMTVGSGLVGLLALVSCLGYGVKYQQFQENIWGAITASEAKVFSDKNENAAVVFKLQTGAPVRIIEHQLGWLKIQISDGKMGWAQEDSVKYFAKSPSKQALTI